MGINGHVLPNTPIAVDYWYIKNCSGVKYFFLTHFHTDHIVGLSSSWAYPIYTSPITATLLIKKLKIRPELVHELDLEKTELLPLDSDGKEMLSVTTVDANHCPGSVMFLFSGYFGNILYSGDFRYSRNLFDNVALPVIDVLYLDNTYCSKNCEFYSREYATVTIIERLQNCLKTSDRVMIGVDNLGKETLMMKIAERLNTKICVEEDHMEILEILNMAGIGTTDPKGCKIFAVNTSKINKQSMARWNKLQTTCAIVATARYTGLGFIPFSQHSNIHIIPYSNHSSFLELQEFVKKVHPCTIIPIIDKKKNKMMGVDITSRSDMSIFLEFTNLFSSKTFSIPQSVKKFMHLPLIPTGLPNKQKVQRREPKVVLRRCDKGVEFISSVESVGAKKRISYSDEKNCPNIDSIENVEVSVTSQHNNGEDRMMAISVPSTTWELLHVTSFDSPKITTLSTNDILPIVTRK